MIDVTIARAFMDSRVTLGMLRVSGVEHPPIYTLELPWKGNRPGISCIPTGVYRGGPHSGQKHQNVFRIDDVPGRTGILIHAGNTAAEIEGCILPGLAAGTMRKEPAVLKSMAAMGALRFILGAAPFTITITQP